MDSDRTFNNCSWRMEVDDAASKDARTSSVPGKTIEDLKLHYDSLSGDVEAIDSGKVPLPDYLTKVSVPKEKKAQRGVSWTEEEHRQFLYGLQRFGRGDWKSISRYCVLTKSNSQVASHAQNYFKRLSSAKEGKRLSINDITTVNPEKLLALEEATTRCMLGCCNEESTKAENQLPECTTEASFDVENQLPEYSNEASGKKRSPKKSLTCNVNQLLPRCLKAASSSSRDQLLPGFPEKAPTDMGNQMLLGSKKARADAGKLPGHPSRDTTDIGCQLPVPSLFGGACGDSSFLGKAIGGDTGSRPVEATTSLGSQLLLGCPMEASTNLRKLPRTGHPDGNRLQPPSPFDGTPSSGEAMGGAGSSVAMLQVCNVFSPPFAMEPGPPAGSVEMRPAPPDGAAGFNNTDADEALDGQFDIGCSTGIMDLDMSLFPHFLD